jgi:hypothetical protein
MLMMKRSLRSGARSAFAAVLLAGASVGVFATPVMDMRAEDLLPMAIDMKKSLNLTPNQETLWLQVEGRSKALLRERQSRRERLQQALKQGLAGARVELRDMSGALEAEAATSAAEEKQLREWWLVVNDALDENQRQQAVTLLSEQLMRVPDSGAQHPAGRGREEGAGRSRGMGRGKPGGGMGTPSS